MGALTDFGDSAVVLPLACVILIWMFLVEGWRPAALWAGAVVLCAAVTALLKLYFSACTAAGAALHSPSGHSSMSALVYGGLAVIIALELGGWRRNAAVILGVGLAIAIGVSRIVLGVHTELEVLVGLAAGLAVLTAFVPVYLRVKPFHVRHWHLDVAAAVTVFVLHGQVLTIEPLLQRLAAILGGSIGLCA
jgi:membrane-associated phospholipid phosphatase